MGRVQFTSILLAWLFVAVTTGGRCFVWGASESDAGLAIASAKDRMIGCYDAVEAHKRYSPVDRLTR